jgi:predicted aldo/keto reductase-like oxidoreductase
MKPMTRREFMRNAALTGGVVASGATILHEQRRGEAQSTLKPAPPSIAGAEAKLPAVKNAAVIKNATDRVSLGRTGLRVSLVGIGTGSNGTGHRSNQTDLGQEAFTKLMRHAFDKGINLFDLADQYGSNPFFQRAMNGVPRDQYVIQTKTGSRDANAARADIDRFLKELNTDHIDSLIIHCVTEGDWTTRFAPVMEVFEQAKQAGKIRSHGVTCHSFEALQAAHASDWVQLNMVRWNSGRSHMDNDVEAARALFTQMRLKGQAMIGMKVMGEGDLLRGAQPLTPEKCCRFQIESGVVDAFVVGVQDTAHIDKMLAGTQTALNELGYRRAPLV